MTTGTGTGFRNALVEADLASTARNRRWVAGSGADASPYFRIFNPIIQGRKFDADGRYLRRWVTELRRAPDRRLHAPGTDHPRPVVDHERARVALASVVAGRVAEGG